MGLAYPQAIRFMVDALVGGRSPLSLDSAAVVLLILFAVQSTFSMLRAWLFTVSGERIVTDLRGRLFEAILRQEAARLSSYDRAVVLAGLGRQAEAGWALVEARAERTLVAGLFAAEPRLASLQGRGALGALLDEARAPLFPPASSWQGPVAPIHR